MLPKKILDMHCKYYAMEGRFEGDLNYDLGVHIQEGKRNKKTVHMQVSTIETGRRGGSIDFDTFFIGSAKYFFLWKIL